MSQPLPSGVKDYIVNHYADMNARQLVEDIRTKFGYPATIQGVRTYASSHGFTKFPNYTPEQEQWLYENAAHYKSKSPLAEAFNFTFGSNKSPYQLGEKVKRLIPGFKFGWSGGRKKGEGESVTAKPIGTETFKGGYWWVKINDYPLPKNYTAEDRAKNWRQKHRLIWETIHGPIPDGYMVTFLDSDPNNCTIENLYLITRRIQTAMVRNQWYSNDAAQTLTAIKWCELLYAIKDAKERLRHEKPTVNSAV